MSTAPSPSKKPRTLETAASPVMSSSAGTPRNDDDVSSNKAIDGITSNQFEGLPLDVIVLMLSFLDDEYLLKDTSVVLSCKRMLQASEGLCEKVFHELIDPSRHHQVDGTFEERLLQSIRRSPGAGVAEFLPWRQKLAAAQQTPLRQRIENWNGREARPLKLVFSPSHKKFAVVCFGDMGYVTIFNTTTMRQIITLRHDYVLDMRWLKEGEEEADEDSFVTLVSHQDMLLWNKTGTGEGVWTSRDIRLPESVLCWTTCNNCNELLVLAPSPRQLDEEDSFHSRVCSFSLQDQTMTTLIPIILSEQPDDFLSYNMFTCGDHKWLLILEQLFDEEDEEGEEGWTKSIISAFNLETNEQTERFTKEKCPNLAQASSDGSCNFFMESYSNDGSTKIVTMYRLGEEDGRLSPVVGSSFPVVRGENIENVRMSAVSESHVACIERRSGIFVYNAKTGTLEKSIMTGRDTDYMIMSSKRDELFNLFVDVDQSEYTIGVYCVGKLPRPT